MNYTLHFISHSHWDREWYMSFEQHRFRLVELMDTLLHTLDMNPDFKSFHLDGQVILLEDYLEIKPHMKEKIKKYAAEGRLKIGPWYILQDEFLISGEANVRNLLYGIRKAKEYGPVCMVGYFPDAFGNISQAPQILRGFGIESAVFGRGVNTVGSNNTVLSGEKPAEYNSELIWKSPDGSEVLGVLFANWYHNAFEVPSVKEKAKEYIKQIRDNAAKFAATPHLLMMNGCDHQPLQADLTDILKEMQSEFAEDLLIHSNFNTYLEEIKNYSKHLKAVEGELTSQFTDGSVTLVNTASARIYLKQLNHKAQNLLEKWVEPFGVIAWLLGDTYRKEFIDKAWQYLMQNHPHDSICGCSVDDVHEEMVVRFKKSIAIAEELLKREIKYILARIDTSLVKHREIPVVVFNPHYWNTAEIVTGYVDFDETDAISAECLGMTDLQGNPVNADFTAAGRTFTYTLPDDSFRKVKYVNRFEVRFSGENIPGLGYKTYIVNKTPGSGPKRLSYGMNFAENEFIRLDIHPDGSLKVTNKADGCTFDNLNILEDSGDIGDEYNFVAPGKGEGITTKNHPADISITSGGDAAVTFKIQHRMQLPEKCCKTSGERSENNTKLLVDSYITLGVNAKRVDIYTEFDNTVCDHRLRALFPSDIQSDCCYADGQFDLVKRAIQPWEGWKNPSNCQRQQAFAEIYDGKSGLAIANRGLPEYEVLRDGHNTIALTLVRSVGELGDWGHFPTPGAQCQGLQRVEYSIIPYKGENGRREAHRQAYQFSASPLRAMQTDIHTGDLEMTKAFIEISSNHIAMSTMKKCEDRESVVLRLYNTGLEEERLDISLNGYFSEIYETNLNEERLQKVNVQGNSARMQSPSKKITTLEIIPLKGG
jgi:alpha-mannosidase